MDKGEVAEFILRGATPEKLKYVPLIMNNVNIDNCFVAGDVMRRIDDGNIQLVIDLFKKLVRDSVGHRVFRDVDLENIKYIPEFLSVLDKEVGRDAAAQISIKLNYKNKGRILRVLKKLDTGYSPSRYFD